MDSGWIVEEPPFHPEHLKAYEGLFTLGSGYMHIRGSLEEHLSGAPQNVTYTRMPANVTSEKFLQTKCKWGTYVPGVFGRHPVLNNEMVNLPFFLGIVPIVDGDRLDLRTCSIENYNRQLNLRTATLTRTFTWRTGAGKRIDMEFARFIDAAHPHLCIQRMRLTPDADLELSVRAGIDADVRTNGYDHFTGVQLSFAGKVGIDCVVRTDSGDTMRGLTRLVAETDWRYESTARTAELVTDVSLPAGRTFVLEKRTAVTTSRDLEAVEAEHLLTDAGVRGYDELHAEHMAVWEHRWRACDVEIDGDDAAQRAMRVSLFHLLRAHVAGDSRVAIDAKGYSGEAYWGRYFWDTEMFLLPFFLYTDPARARTLVDFRVQSLEGARRNAAKYGYPGARYGWESDAEGDECCPNWQYADHEVHVTADVAYGLTHYARATGDEDYLRGPAAEVLVETARYWLARLDQRDGDEYLSLLGVMGPDEYTPISSNNAFTNAMVGVALFLASCYGRFGGATVEECEAFAAAADALPEPRSEDGTLVLQCEEFEALAEPRFEELWKDRSRSFAAQVSQERLYRSRCLKQADVLMLMMLFPDNYTAQEVRTAWDYYLPYTTHDSSLSAGVHAIVATRLGLKDEAWRFWQTGRGIDLDVERGGAAEGIHIANAGAMWQMAVFGFAGMQTAMGTQVAISPLTLTPRLPDQWSRLAFPVVWKGVPVHVEITRKAVGVLNLGTGPLVVRVGDRDRKVEAGEQIIWETPT
ncbi:MAG: glycoside hydrolase family 65 protein [Phycisphaerae bacterium]|nr:glycoside hydrolase family 65 protein [Phycisphaerae bacterium]